MTRSSPSTCGARRSSTCVNRRRYQVAHNLESQRLQYGMEQRLRSLGWQEIEVIDEDLGRSGGGDTQRAGFERMVADVCLGKVGAVAAREVSRFARNSREWQQLIEVCRVVDTLLVDLDTVYAPRQSNDRLLLRLKGSLNEYELDLLRQRSVEARHEKARRGELLVGRPRRVRQDRRPAVGEGPRPPCPGGDPAGVPQGSRSSGPRQTLLWFLEEGLKLPTRRQDGETRWKRPTYATIHRILTNPAYGGAYAYGKTERPRLTRRPPRRKSTAAGPRNDGWR